MDPDMLTVRLDQVKKTVLLIFLPCSKQLMTRHKVIVLQLYMHCNPCSFV